MEMSVISNEDNNIKCSLCDKSNTEFIKMTGNIDIHNEIVNRMSIQPISYIKRVVYRYVKWLVNEPIKKDIYMCQSCASKSFRQFNKSK